jgi:RimJ/RimL family protein N-acetyltransferase
VTLRPFDAGQICERYLRWLSDPEVNAYSRRSGQAPITAADAERYLASLAAEEVVLGIHLAGEGHVGNVKFGPVDRVNDRCDISILIGEKKVWGRGVGKEAVYLVSRHLFEEVGLHRLDAGSGNPAFIAMVERLGWRREGVLRQRVRIGERLVDCVLLAQLRPEFHRRPELEAPS